MPLVAIIGCGNPTRSDDGVGGEVIRRLAAGALGRIGPPVRLCDAGTDGMAVMFEARGCRSLIIVDSCRSGAPAGAIFEVPAAELDPPAPATLGTHELRWNHALVAGRRIFGDAFPPDATVFLIEAASIAPGLDLSAPVAAAAQRVRERIEERVLAIVANSEVR